MAMYSVKHKGQFYIYLCPHIQGCIQKFPDWVTTKWTTTINTR